MARRAGTGGGGSGARLRPMLAQQDVDRVAVASARGVASQPVQVIGIAARHLAEGPALVAAEVEALAGAVGVERTTRRAMGRIVRGRGRGSAAPIGLPCLPLYGIPDDGVRPVEVGH